MPTLSTSPTSTSRQVFARNTGFMLVSHVGRMLIQAAYFVILARSLGASGLGGFTSLTALVAVVAPLASFGAVNLLIRNIVRDPDRTPTYYRTAMGVITVTGLLLTGLVMASHNLFVADSITPQLVLCIVVADLFGPRYIEVAASVYSAQERMSRTAALHIASQITRLAGALALLLSPTPFTLEAWAWIYLGTSVVPALAVHAFMLRKLGAGRADWWAARRDLREGALFSVSFASQSIYNDLDKVMLGRLATLEATGIYAAAYRVVDLSFAPMRALLSAAYPRFFRAGVHGLAGTMPLAVRLIRPGLLVSAAASVGLFACAPVLPFLLGNEFDPAVSALQALAVLPVLRALHFLPADALTGAGMQGTRSLIQVGAVLANVALNVWLIPSHGFWGAIYATLATDTLLVVLMWTLVLARVRRAPREAVKPAS